MAALICILVFFCNTPDPYKNVFTVFIDHQNMGVDTLFGAVSCDIHRAINRYTFFGNGGANLHTKFSETYRITLINVILPSFTLKTWV